MNSYQKQIKDLYMPKPNDKKRAELEQAISKLRHQPREAKQS